MDRRAEAVSRTDDLSVEGRKIASLLGSEAAPTRLAAHSPYLMRDLLLRAGCRLHHWRNMVQKEGTEI